MVPGWVGHLVGRSTNFCNSLLPSHLEAVAKRFSFTSLSARVRLQGRAALGVASNGIASLLLDDGKTAHSLFKIPVQVHAHSAKCP